MLDSEHLLGPVGGERLEPIDELLALVVPAARVALRVLVGEDAPHRLEHGARDVVLGRDQADRLRLSGDLISDQFGDRRIRSLERRLCQQLHAHGHLQEVVECAQARGSLRCRSPVVLHLLTPVAAAEATLRVPPGVAVLCRIALRLAPFKLEVQPLLHCILVLPSNPHAQSRLRTSSHLREDQSVEQVVGGKSGALDQSELFRVLQPQCGSDPGLETNPDQEAVGGARPRSPAY